MPKIKILDCTLRDGGYVNNWEFGKNNIHKTIENLTKAGIEFIECGFLKNSDFIENKSFFDSFKNLKNFIPENNSNTKYALMINYGEVDIDLIPENFDKNLILRIAFKKKQANECIKYCEKLIQKGYDIFINPMHTGLYSSIELIDLIKKANKIKPLAFTIVDTTGSMKEQDLLSIYYLVDSNLDKNIALCFHSHNNLQLSFSNAQCLMNICKNREIIIDATVFGMGRGAGNLCIELLAQYINDNYNGNYDIIPILKTIDEQINPIFAQTPWGYSVPYYLAAVNDCHPNYAKYLVDKQTIPVEIINELLITIPNDKKTGYDANLIKQIYLDKFSNRIDDTKTIEYLKEKLSNRNILLLAPGKSLNTEKETIEDYIKKNNPFVISMNFSPKDYKKDLVFTTNIKRFSLLDNFQTPTIITSNIEEKPTNSMILNYSTYLNNSKMYDNAALMLLKLLIEINTKQVSIAGMDGFSLIPSENYAEGEYMTNKACDCDERNLIMSEELNKLQDKIKINFVTKTLYNLR